MQIRISFRSRSDLVLEADNALDLLSNLVLQACISFCSVSDKSGASVFLPCSHKNAVDKMPLLILSMSPQIVAGSLQVQHSVPKLGLKG